MPDPRRIAATLTLDIKLPTRLQFTGSSGSKPSFLISYLLLALLGFHISRYILKLFIYLIYSNVQRVGVSEVSLVVVSQLGAKLTSTDRGQASEVIVGS